MTSVAILTFYYKTYNYGAMLQAYALTKTINNMGVDCRQISYIRDKKGLFLRKIRRIIQVPGRQRRVFFEIQLKKLSGKISGRKPSQYTICTIEAFDRFAEEIPHTEVVNRDTIQNLVPDFDVFVVGSDQVWNPEFVTMRFFFDFLPDDKRRASYAASIRVPRYEKKEGRIIRGLLEKFCCITVREKGAVQILKRIGVDKDIKVVLDPTMLLTKDSWCEMLTDPEIYDKYVLTYLIRDNSVRRKIEELARERGLKIIEVTRPNDESRPEGDLYIQLDYVGPREFAGLIKNAEFVFPDSFHGTALSVIFQKEFVVISGDNTDERKHSILAALGLKNRIVSPDGDIQATMNNPIDYQIVEKKLSVLRENSMNILREIVL